MKKHYLYLSFCIATRSIPEGYGRSGVINMRDVLGTQVAIFLKALSEETDYAANIEKAIFFQTERQALAEKLQKMENLLLKINSRYAKRDSEKGRRLNLLLAKFKPSKSNEKDFCRYKSHSSKILLELEKRSQTSFARKCSSDPALVLTDDVTSLLDVALAEGQNNN